MLRIIAIWFIILLTLPVAASAVLNTDPPKYEKGKKRNPFIPIVTNEGQIINIEEEEKEAHFTLEGIIFDKEGQSLAIINGQILKKNDMILDAKIVEIRKDSVVYVKDGEIFILEAEKGEGK
ncbi:MAG: hypothetical protein ABIA97_06285 [Candidatus Omnitrophota bacterium]